MTTNPTPTPPLTPETRQAFFAAIAELMFDSSNKPSGLDPKAFGGVNPIFSFDKSPAYDFLVGIKDEVAAAAQKKKPLPCDALIHRIIDKSLEDPELFNYLAPHMRREGIAIEGFAPAVRAYYESCGIAHTPKAKEPPAIDSVANPSNAWLKRVGQQQTEELGKILSHNAAGPADPAVAKLLAKKLAGRAATLAERHTAPASGERQASSRTP